MSAVTVLGIRSVDALLDPLASAWEEVPEESVPLAPTPLEGQTSAYVREAWRGRPYGQTPQVRVRAAHDGQRLALRLSWEAPERRETMTDDDVFADAACVLFAPAPDTPINMGSPQRPVRGWLWRADWPQPRAVSTQGPGTSQRGEGEGLAARASWQDGRWTVALLGPLPREHLLALAIWRGANMERAGLKAHSPQWQQLQIHQQEG